MCCNGKSTYLHTPSKFAMVSISSSVKCDGCVYKILIHLKELTLEGLALIEAGQKFDYLCLHLMCHDPKKCLFR